MITWFIPTLQALNVSKNAAINTDKGNLSDPVESSAAESKYSSDDSPHHDDMRNVVEQEMDEVKSSEAVDDQKDTDDQIQQTLEELQLADDNKIQEDHSASNTEKDPTDEILSEEIAVAGMETNPVPDPIGWV